MDNSLYNSLTNQLIQNGILEETSSGNLKPEENFFQENSKISSDEETYNDEKNTDNPILQPKKRLNRFEYNTENYKQKKDKNIFSIFSKDKKGKNMLARFFPKLYKAHLAKDALKELSMLDINTDELRNKTIPYGESESRYKNLIKYLKCANKIQTKIDSELD